ncbi:hypothetical protein DL95DRAFT_402235 [Leptodontidium sp. 2 PMI_412]|nr:hypothetical protein DL95DRAFT_402235 [Leptodontidium sp. 2 PMI_412]
MATNHNNNALFDGYNLARAKDVRFLAVAMTGYLLGTGNSLKLHALNAARRETITRLAIQMVTDIPLTTAITNLVAADRTSDDQMITHGEILQVFAYTVPPAVRPAIKPVPTDSLPQNLVERNTPGARAIEDTTLDMGFAKAGTPDKSKYKFKIDFEKPVPHKKNKWDYCSTKYYDWLEDHPEPSWDSAKSLSRLNQWRSQIFKRYFGVKRKPRDHWSVSEKNLVVKLMKKDLEKSSFVRWKRLANNYNNITQGKGQDAEEAKAWKLVSKSDKLGEQRSAPWRTMSAIRVQTSKWEETKDLEEVARAGETSEVESTDDEKEIPDPKTDSEKIDARHKNRLEAKTKGNTMGKETAGSKGGARTKGNGKRKRQVVEDENTESHGEVLKPAARRRQKV